MLITRLICIQRRSSRFLIPVSRSPVGTRGYNLGKTDGKKTPAFLESSSAKASSTKNSSCHPVTLEWFSIQLHTTPVVKSFPFAFKEEDVKGFRDMHLAFVQARIKQFRGKQWTYSSKNIDCFFTLTYDQKFRIQCH